MTVRILVCGKIRKPFAVKCFRIEIVAGGTDKYLRIACPAETFIALRAVGRDIDKVAFLSPDDIVEQLIYSGFELERKPVRCRSEQTTTAVKMSGRTASAPPGK